MNRSPTPKKIKGQTLTLDDMFNIYRTSFLKAYTFLSTNGTFTRINNILGPKTGLNKFKKNEIISGIFFNHNGIKVEINYKKPGKFV